jgi:hypothetical protein
MINLTIFNLDMVGFAIIIKPTINYIYKYNHYYLIKP